MKTPMIILFVASIVFVACNSKQLDKQTAMEVIKKNVDYPMILDRDIYCSDPEHARKLMIVGLEKDGLITVQKTRKLGDANKPLIQFTAKAQPYLLETPEKDKAHDIQKVKLAEEDIAEIVSIKDDENTKTKLVEYITTYKNITPFAALTNQNFTIVKTHKVYLSLQAGNWQIERSMKR